VPPGSGIRRKVHLETPVEQKSVLYIGPHATADVIRRLEDGDLRPTFSEYFCADEASQPGPDNNGFHTRESVTHNSEQTVIALTRMSRRREFGSASAN
jgi:hypothetical protein